MNSIPSIFEREMRDGIVHGAVVYAGTPGRELYKAEIGYADNAHQFPMHIDTVIDIASVTKVAACVTALLICRSRGWIDFDAPFTEYLPDFKAKLFVPIRIRDLANHTSGFGEVPGETCRPYFDESGLQMLENMLTVPPPYPPTEEARYACWNYILLAMILERITGCRFPEFCRNEIFLPLQMNDSAVGKPPPVPPERLAQTFGTEHQGMISDFVAFRIYRDGGATGNAGMFSSARDLGKLLRCYLRHGKMENGSSLFDEESFREIVPDRAKKFDGYRRFGWIIYDALLWDAAYGTSLLHSGWSGQTVFLDLERNFYAVVLTTRCGDYDRAKQERFRVIRTLTEELPILSQDQTTEGEKQCRH